MIKITENKIVEIQIKKMSQLSDAAKQEVREKLDEMAAPFDFKGYAKVSYAESSPLRVVSVDPIEGTVIDYFTELAKQIHKTK